MVVDEVLVSLTESRTARSSLVLFGSLFHFSTFAIDLSSFELLPLELLGEAFFTAVSADKQRIGQLSTREVMLIKDDCLVNCKMMIL